MKTLIVRVDVTDLSEREIEALAMEMCVQAEESEGYPDEGHRGCAYLAHEVVDNVCPYCGQERVGDRDECGAVDDGVCAGYLAAMETIERTASPSKNRRRHRTMTVAVTLEIQAGARVTDSDVISAVEHALDDGTLQDAINACGLKVVSAVRS